MVDCGRAYLWGGYIKVSQISIHQSEKQSKKEEEKSRNSKKQRSKGEGHGEEDDDDDQEDQEDKAEEDKAEEDQERQQEGQEEEDTPEEGPEQVPELGHGPQPVVRERERRQRWEAPQLAAELQLPRQVACAHALFSCRGTRTRTQ
eukprot:COSAG05_NODE_1839_length_3984_cov_6.299871_3_plen_146_part_00